MDYKRAYFEQTLWPHLRGAYNLARWLTRNDQDAEDIVQESFAKAFTAIGKSSVHDPRLWLLKIVRNTAMNHLSRSHSGRTVPLEETAAIRDPAAGPEEVCVEHSRRERVRTAIEMLPNEFREPLVLREIEGLSYKEIGAVLSIPMGTVMSRIARARGRLVHDLLPEKEASRDL